MVLDFDGKNGLVIVIGYLFISVLIDLEVGLWNFIVEFLINIVWVLMVDGI